MPSPIRLIRRWTRKNPTAGASTPTTAPAANARRMKSASKMDMRGVVPGAGERRGCAVEDDRAADEHEPLDEALDGAELVRHEQDRHAKVAVQVLEQLREGLLSVDVHSRCGFVQHDQVRAGRKRLRDERTLLLPARQRRERSIRPV